MCAREAQQQAAEQDVQQAGESEGDELLRHGLNSNYFLQYGKVEPSP
jgi:orotate phosphoribosyltransferase